MTIRYLGFLFVRVRRPRMHRAAGTILLASTLRGEASPSLAAANTGPRQARRPGLWISYVLTLAAAVIGTLASCPRAQAEPLPPHPAPDLPARADVLAVARGLPAAFDELEVRLVEGRARAREWKAVLSADRIAALHFNHAPAHARRSNERAAEVGARPASAAVAGLNSNACPGWSRARCSGPEVGSAAGAAEVSKRVARAAEEP